MGGYAPLFDSIATGTLYGRWPDIGVWPIVLALADKSGNLDVTPHYLAGVLGLPVDEVAACMKRFCQPDPYSRSKESSGARLILIDAHRDWGWVIVNHGKYREKARKQLHQQSATESGMDAERKRLERASGDVRRCPDATGSQTHTQTQTKTGGLDEVAWQRWIGYRREIGKALKPASIPSAQRAFARLGAHQAAAVEHSIANGWTGLFSPNKGKSDPPGPNGHDRVVV